MREDSFLGREGDLLITGLHVIMMCVRVLVGAFVFYNDAWSPAPLGAALFAASLQRPEPVTFHLPIRSRAGPTAGDLACAANKEAATAFQDAGSHFLHPRKSDWMCRSAASEAERRRVAMLSLSARFSTDVSRLMSYAQLAPPTAAIAQTVYHTFTTVITHKLSAA